MSEALRGSVSQRARQTVTTALDNVSVAASGTENSAAVDADWARQARVVIEDSGADITVTLQASADSGTTWHDVTAYTTGATGAQTIDDLCDDQVRLSAANGGAGAQSVTANLVLQT